MPSIAGVTVTWDAVFGAYDYTVQSALVGLSWGNWTTNSARYDTTWAESGQTYQYQVQAICGDVLSGWTNVVSATANPTVAPGPSNIVVSSTADGFDMSWDVVEGYDIDVYAVFYWDTSIANSYVAEFSFTSTSVSITGQNPGDNFLLAVQTWENVDGVPWAGLPAVAGNVIVGGIPEPPTNFQVVTINEGATVQMTWDASEYASGYRIWTRYLNNATDIFHKGVVTTGTCLEATYFFPGSWNYEFCITAINGNYETVLFGCTVPSETITTVSDCPVPSTTVDTSGSTPTVTWSSPSVVTATPYPGVLVCVSGTGSGDYAQLCSFTCKYGFCPSPCNCDSEDVQITPPTVDTAITGYAAAGFDAPTYGPLCNWACSHGYCPASECLEEVTMNPDETVPETSVLGLASYTSPDATYSDGDLFTYVSSDDSDYTLDVILIGGNSSIEDITCDVIVAGEYGDGLGCIAEAAEFLIYSILDDAYALAKRDSISDYHFNVHPDWQSASSCTTHCMLLAGAPLHSWTPVGNGTFKGVYHELHFLNTGKTIGYKASRHSSTVDLPTGKVLGSRGVIGMEASMYFTPGEIANFQDMGIDITLPNPKKRISELYAVGAEGAAIYGYLHHCDSFKYTGDVEVTGATVINFGSASDFSSEDADNALSSCETEEAAPKAYAIFPVDNFDIDDISAILATLPNANVVEHISVSGWGMLYWTADLTPAQWGVVVVQKQVGAHLNG